MTTVFIFIQIVAVISTACFCLVEKRLKREDLEKAPAAGCEQPKNLNDQVVEGVHDLQPELQRLKKLERIE